MAFLGRLGELEYSYTGSLCRGFGIGHNVGGWYRFWARKGAKTREKQGKPKGGANQAGDGLTLKRADDIFGPFSRAKQSRSPLKGD